MSNSQPQHDSIDYPDEPTQPHDVASWYPRVETVDDVDVQPVNYAPNDSPIESRFLTATIGWVISPSETLADYIDEHGRGTIDVPQYYSHFDDCDSHLATAPGIEDDDATTIDPTLVRASIRVLHGKGRYPADEHTLYDCLPYPCPLVRDDVGAVLITPRIAPDGLED